MAVILGAPTRGDILFQCPSEGIESMAKELKPIDISEVPDLLRIAQQVRDSGEPCLLTRAGEEIAILAPVKPARRTGRKSGIVTRGDTLWNIVGMASSDRPGDVARNKHQYLAEAYATKRE